MMTPSQTEKILARLKLGFQTSPEQLKALETALSAEIRLMRDSVPMTAPDKEWHSHWRGQWDEVESILRRTRLLVDEAGNGLADTQASAGQSMAAKVWERLAEEDRQMLRVLEGLRADVIGLNQNGRKEWNHLAGKINLHLELLHTCAHSNRIRAEMMRTKSREEVDRLLIQALEALPSNLQSAEQVSSEQANHEHEVAEAQLDKERHVFLGTADVFKGLLMWIETTEERTRHNLSLKVDAA